MKKNRKIEEILSVTPLFRGLPRGQIGKILSSAGYYLTKHPRGKLLFQRGDTYRELLILLKGVLYGELIDGGGKVLRLREVHAPEAISPGILFGKEGTFPVNLNTGEEVLLLHLSSSALLALLGENEILLKNFLTIIANRFTYLSEKLNFLNFNTIGKKLAFYLLELKGEGEVKIPHSIKELAEFFGVERPSLSKVLGDFVREGLILCPRRRYVVILDPGRLEGMLR